MPNIRRSGLSWLRPCSRCGIEKPRDAFRRQPKNKDGLQSWCIDCANARTLEWRRAKGIGPRRVAPMRPCQQCGTPTKNERHCSLACRDAYRYRGRCLRCDTPMRVPAPSHRDREGKYCSKACYYASRTKATPPEPIPVGQWMRRHRAKVVRLKRCRECKAEVPKAQQRCYPCGLLATYTAKQMNRKSPTTRAAQRRAKHKRRTLMQTLYRDEDIFRRDGYRCHFRNTGQCVMARAKCKPNANRMLDDWAPTIDHIVPLARGGADTPDNVACAHRKCNWYWSDRGTVQLRLAA
jgi:hypothetical protein